MSEKLLEVIVGLGLNPQLGAMWEFVTLNETTPVYATGRISPLYSLSNSSLIALECLSGNSQYYVEKGQGDMKAMTSDLFH